MALNFKQLGQIRPNNISNNVLYSPAANIVGTGRYLSIANTTTQAVSYRLFVDDDGSVFDESTSIAWDISLPPLRAESLEVFIPMSNSAGNFGVHSSVTNGLTFTLFGGEE